MSWWQRFILGTAASFFQALLTMEPHARAEAKRYALPIYRSIKEVFAGDPDFEKTATPDV